MEWRLDFIDRQIDTLGKLLEKLLNDHPGIEPDNIIIAPISNKEKALTIEGLATIKNEELINVLVNEHGYNAGNIRQLADLLYALGGKIEMSDLLSEKALVLYEYYVSTNTTSIDFVVFNRISYLKKDGPPE
jgi:hypothetical protein